MLINAFFRNISYMGAMTDLFVYDYYWCRMNKWNINIYSQNPVVCSIYKTLMDVNVNL